MRKIKFRAWYGGDMMYGINLYDGLFNDGGYGYGEGDTHRDVPVMQYTGLDDKNDMEIYEGDIVVRYPDGDNGIVEIDKGVYTMSGDYRLPLCNEVVEIIGNIYENPELIK